MNQINIQAKYSWIGKLIACLFLIAFVLLFLLTYYKAEIHFHGNFNNKYIKYYLIFAFGALFWAMILRAKNKHRINIVMSALILVVGFYLLEITFTIRATKRSNGVDKIKIAAKGFDTRSKLQILQDLKKEGIDATLVIGPKLFNNTTGLPEGDAIFTFGGISRKYTVYCNETGKYSTFLSDRFGFNNPDSEWDSPKTDWAILGDSIAAGACVASGEEISAKIRSITGSSVINLASAMADPLHELATLKEYLEFKKPKNVLWIYSEATDLFELARNSSTNNPSSILMKYLNPGFSQNLANKQPIIDDRIKKYITQMENQNLIASSPTSIFDPISLIVKFKKSFLSFPTLRKIMRFDQLTLNANDGLSPIFVKILTIARDQVSAWGGKLYFVYMPHPFRYTTKVKNPSKFLKRGKVLDLLERLNISTIDMTKTFQNHPDVLALFPFRYPSGHFNAEGYGFIAKTILTKAIIEQP